NGRAPSALRDLLAVESPLQPIPIDEVEPVEAILKRFDSAGMSLGALSPEAHESLAIAMNRRVTARKRLRRSNKLRRAASASPLRIWSVPRCCRSRSRRAQSPAKAV